MTEYRSGMWGIGNVQVDLGMPCPLEKQGNSLLRQEGASWKTLPDRASEWNLRKVIAHFWKTHAN